MDFVTLAFKGAILLVSSDFVHQGHDYVHANQVVAEQLALENEAILPTPELVDEIYKQSTCKVTSPALDPANPKSFKRHDEAIRKAKSLCKDMKLVDGHKKTIVQSNRKGRMAIYGWFPNGKRIQPYSTVHDSDYTDYSQGVRLVAKWAYKDGKKVLASSILNP